MIEAGGSRSRKSDPGNQRKEEEMTLSISYYIIRLESKNGRRCKRRVIQLFLITEKQSRCAIRSRGRGFFMHLPSSGFYSFTCKSGEKRGFSHSSSCLSHSSSKDGLTFIAMDRLGGRRSYLISGFPTVSVYSRKVQLRRRGSERKRAKAKKRVWTAPINRRVATGYGVGTCLSKVARKGFLLFLNVGAKPDSLCYMLGNAIETSTATRLCRPFVLKILGRSRIAASQSTSCFLYAILRLAPILFPPRRQDNSSLKVA